LSPDALQRSLLLQNNKGLRNLQSQGMQNQSITR
jgi:hypothetical protein